MRAVLLLTLPCVVSCMLTDSDRSVGPVPEGVPTEFQSGGSCQSDNQCDPGTVCFNQFCVGQGALRFSLAFQIDSDFDLHVVPPTGQEIFFGQKTGGGGYLDVDQCVGPCGNGAHVENVFFEGPTPGNYQFWVVNYEARAAGPFQIVVDARGRPLQTFNGFASAPSGTRSQAFSFLY